MRPYSIIFHPIAKKELDESINWYENALIGLGKEFIEEIEAVVKLLEVQPGSFEIKKYRLREAVVRRFPYLVIYRINGSKVIITSVFHSSRNPKGKYKKR